MSSKLVKNNGFYDTFVHLHVHSDYSILHGANKVKDIVAKMKELELPAFALTDTNAMYGAYEFSQECAKNGIQPIVGCHIKLEDYGDIVLISKSEKGYINISTILSKASIPNKTDTGTYEKWDEPKVTKELLFKYKEDLIVLSGGLNGLLYKELSNKRYDEANNILREFKKEFGEDFYIEICRYENLEPLYVEIEQKAIKLAFDFDIPLVATSETFYTTRDRFDSYEILRALDNHEVISITDESFHRENIHDMYIRTADEMKKLFKDLPEAYNNTIYIALKSHYMVEPRQPILPPFETEGGRSEEEELTAQSIEGLDERLEEFEISIDKHKEYKDRLDFELKVIKQMGFPGYFLIVSDFIKWAKENDIPVGPGRGSGAGSIVAWALKITDLDPIQWGLLFERFLNPDRVSMPDFDIDFCKDRREEVIRYVKEKYGSDKVSHIITFGKIGSKNAIKDTGRYLQHERLGSFTFKETNDITKYIPAKPGSADPMPIAMAIEEAEEIKKMYEESDRIKLLFDTSQRIENLYKSTGAHAAGIVIGDRPIYELVPLKWDSKTDTLVTQFNMKAVESVGLVKFDFLGLKNLTIIKKALDLIKDTTGKELNITKIPLDDKKTYEMLSDGNTTGVFQLESDGMRKVLKDIKPTCFEDIIAVVSLYRPGPMDQIPFYADAKNGKIQPKYPEPANKTKPVLEETFGIMVYQEQVMKIAQEVAGYTLGQADLLRRAMGKKIAEEMEKQKAVFVDGAAKNGVSKKDAESLFAHIEKFASYGFNKSHAAAYALIAYQTAFLKRYYPVAFYSALLSFEGEPEKMSLIKDDLDKHYLEKDDNGVPIPQPIKLLLPCINNSNPDFSPEVINKNENGVRFGLIGIKSIQNSASLLNVIEERKNNGKYKDLFDFYERAGKKLNKGQLEKLAEAGAFDNLCENRNKSLKILTWLNKSRKKVDERQIDMFSSTNTSAEIILPDDIEKTIEWGDKIDKEFNAVGFYFHQHPIDPFVPKLMKANVKRRLSVLKHYLKNKGEDKVSFRICVMVDKLFMRKSQKGNEYIQAYVSEQKDKYEVKFFTTFSDKDISELFTTLDNAKTNKRPVIIAVDGNIDYEKENIFFFGQEVYDAETFVKNIYGNLVIELDGDKIEEPQKLAGKIYKTLENYQTERHNSSKITIYITYKDPDIKPKRSILPGKYQLSLDIEEQLKTIPGIKSIKETSQ